MRAVSLEAVGHLEMKDLPVPSIARPDDVLIQVRIVGVCGSEVHAFEGTHPFRQPPAVLGHELAGVVIETGSGVTQFRPGDRVVVDPQWSCGECEYCRSGDINLCPKKKVLGTQSWPGAFGEFLVAPEGSVFHLPDALSFAQGSLIEPLTVAVHVAERAAIGPGKSVAVLGTGSIGGLVCGVSRALGAGPIIAADIRQHCLDAARERMGATDDILLPDANFVDRVMALTGGAGVDVVVIAADAPELVNLGLEILKRRGTILLVALLTEEPLSFLGFKVISKEAHIIGSTMSNHADVRQAIQMAASGQVDVAGIVTHTLPIEEAQRGMDLARTKADGAIKVLLEYEG